MIIMIITNLACPISGEKRDVDCRPRPTEHEIWSRRAVVLVVLVSLSTSISSSTLSLSLLLLLFCCWIASPRLA